MPEIKVDASQLTALANDAKQAPKVTRDQAVAAVKGASFAVEKKVKIEMPVDTGRARASWGHWNATLLKEHFAKSEEGKALIKSKEEADDEDAIWEVEDDGLTIIQGSNVPYIEDLNSGSSTQAPAGFLDRAAAKGQIELEVKVGQLDPLSKEYAMRIFEDT